MIENVGVTPIFATPIWAVDLKEDDALALNARLLREIEALMGNPRPVLAPGTNWQTDPMLQKLPQFAELVALVEKAGRGALDFLQLQARDIVVSGCWANVNPPGGRNSSHSHPNNFLAAVYYIQTPGADDKIEFEDPRPQAQVMMPRQNAPNPYTVNTISFTVKPGRLVLFPAWLRHAVPAKRSRIDRISFAFNLMFRNYVEDSSPALWRGTVPVDPAAAKSE